jgi:acetolactate synthase-1/2/3 large subunit
MKINDAIISFLRDFGVKYVYGVSGANIEHIHDSIHRLGQGKLMTVMSKSESGAAFMADAHARVHHTLGVCCATSGGGMLNLLVGVAESYMESVPVLALVGQAPLSLEGKGAFQDSSGLERSVHGEQLWGSVAKHMVKIKKAEEFWPEFLGSLRMAFSGRPGPVVILLPRDVYDLEVTEPKPEWLEELLKDIQPKPSDATQVNLLRQALETAKKPVMIIGQGVRNSLKTDAIVQFALETGIPVATTMSSLGAYPNQEDNYLGMIGMAGHPSVHQYILKEADLILVVGSGLSILNRGPLGSVLDAPKTFFVNIDGCAVRHSFPKAQLIEADAGDFFEKLFKQRSGLSWSMPKNYKRQVYKPVLAKSPSPQGGEGSGARSSSLLQSEAILALQEYLPSHGHLVFDAGNCAAAAMHYTQVPVHTSSTIALGMGGMGYSIGAAIGAQLGSDKGARTVVFVGDGAFLMAGLEIHTAVALNLPILYVVFNNNQHGMCTTRQNLYFEGRLECVSYPSVDIAQIAKGFGDDKHIWVGQASNLSELKACLKDYQEHINLTGVLDLRISQEEVPPFTAFLQPDAEVIDS